MRRARPDLDWVPAAAKAALVGAKTVNWALAFSAAATPVSFRSLTKVVCIGEADMFSMMSRSGSIACPPIMGFITPVSVSGIGLGSVLETAPSAPPIIMAAPAANPAMAARFMGSPGNPSGLRGINAELLLLFQRLAFHLQSQPTLFIGVFLCPDFSQLRRQFGEPGGIAVIEIAVRKILFKRRHAQFRGSYFSGQRLERMQIGKVHLRCVHPGALFRGRLGLLAHPRPLRRLGAALHQKRAVAAR